MSKPKRSTTFTLRVDQDILDALKDEAGRQGVSANVLVNKQLRKYVDWGRFSERYGMISISKNALRRLLRVIPDETLRELATEGGREGPIDIILFVWGEVTMENVIKLLHIFAVYHGMGDLEEHDENGRKRFVFHHDMGPKRSIYIEAFFKSMFKSLFNYSPKFETTHRTVAFTISPSEINVSR
ncbi:MAG: hypothetical protein HYU39_01730 [Thaumarchaeota archaeon]|nr:hypothetical protein [Nitrososphaerota archaeon]